MRGRSERPDAGPNRESGFAVDMGATQFHAPASAYASVTIPHSRAFERGRL